MDNKLVKRGDGFAGIAMPSAETLMELADKYKTLEEFQELLDSAPDKAHIRKNKQVAGQPAYLPIDFVEAELNRLFHGLWNCYTTDIRVVVQEIVYTVQLEVFNPFAKIWLSRTGTGAAQIRMKKNSSVLDAESKIKTALTGDAPHALAEAMKNAAKKFGRRLGSGLSREDKALDFGSFDDLLVGEEDMGNIEKELDACKTQDEVKAIWAKYVDLQDKPAFRNRIRSKGNSLK